MKKNIPKIFQSKEYKELEKELLDANQHLILKLVIKAIGAETQNIHLRYSEMVQ